MAGCQDCAARRPMGGDRRVKPLRAVAVEAIQRLVEQPQRRAARHDPGQPRPLGLAGRQQADRDMRPAASSSKRVHRLASRGPLQKASARPSGSSRSSARPSSASAASARSIRPAFGRSSPATSRIRLDLPLPLGPVTCSASPGSSSGRALRTAAGRRGPAPRPSPRSSGLTCSSSACMSSSLRPK